MRIGINPEKVELNKIEYKSHRVIIPVYIPDSEKEYFKNLFSVFKTSLNSLLKTTNKKDVAITIINNNCKQEVTDYLNDLLSKKIIDKHIHYSKNYGKTYTIIAEARSVYEKYLTIADADVFYFNNWENEVFEVFNEYDKVGVVCPQPSPHLTFYANNSLFNNFFLKIKKGSVVGQECLNLFEEGANTDVFTGKKFDWRKNQFYLEKNNIKVCVGAMHFVATYRTEIFNEFKLLKPEHLFRKGDLTFYLDNVIDSIGYGRVSTIKAFVYHLGNTIPEFEKNYNFLLQPKIVYPKYKFKKSSTKNRILLKIFRKIKAK